MFFRDFFYFRKSDRRVLMILVVVAVFCVGLLLGRNLASDAATDSDAPVAGGSPMKSSPSGSEGNSFAATLHTFDPNTIDSASLVSFGVVPWKVRNFVHYRAAGKVFRTPDDLLDTYGWEEADLELLRPYITIGEQYAAPLSARRDAEGEKARHRDRRNSYQQPTRRQRYAANQYQEESQRTHVFDTSNKFHEHTLVDINTADTTLLQRIPGIGSHFSNSIVRLRERLGGFISIEQLFEISNFPESTIDWFEVRDPQLRCIDINHAEFRQLVHHPYISYDQARVICSFIRLHGPFTGIDQLRSTHIFTDEELQRVTPYLSFQ